MDNLKKVTKAAVAALIIALGAYVAVERPGPFGENQARLAQLESDMAQQKLQDMMFRAQVMGAFKQFGGQVGQFIQARERLVVAALVKGDCRNLKAICQHTKSMHKNFPDVQRLDCKKVYNACLKRGVQ